MPPVPEVVSEAVKRWDEAQNHHRSFVRAYERGERAYRGILRPSDDAAKWRHQYAPKYAFNQIETIVSNTMEQGLRFQSRPSPHSQASLEEAMDMIHKADAVGDLLRWQHRIDGWDEQQRSIFLVTALGGLAVLKPCWDYRTQNVPKQVTKMKTVEHPLGFSIDVPTISSEVIQEARDHSTTELCDPRDFVWHESARSLDPFKPGGAQYVFHRCWYSFEQLKMMEASGYLKNVDQLKESWNFDGEYSEREKQLWDVNREKDLIEVLEYWCMKRGTVFRSIIGNRMVLLRAEEETPFSHGSYPFVDVSPYKQPFTVRGVSDIELIEELQAMLWEFGNQRLDNVELINNWITMVRKDVDDLESFEYFPGAFWEVQSPDQIKTLQPPYQLAEATMGVEAGIRSDMQNVTSATPFAGGTMASNASATSTATGASIVMNAAQQRMIAKKWQAQLGLIKEANMRIKLCQQFISKKQLVHILGPDGALTFKEIDPLSIQGEYVVELEAMGESNMRQERRAEALQWSGFLMQSAGLFAAGGKPLNLQEVVKWAAERWDIEDVDRFFSQQPESMGAMAAPGPGGGGPGAAPPPAGPPGITSGEAIDASSPSAAGQISGSPVAAMSRALAAGGGQGNQ